MNGNVAVSDLQNSNRIFVNYFSWNGPAGPFWMPLVKKQKIVEASSTSTKFSYGPRGSKLINSFVGEIVAQSFSRHNHLVRGKNAANTKCRGRMIGDVIMDKRDGDLVRAQNLIVYKLICRFDGQKL